MLLSGLYVVLDVSHAIVIHCLAGYCREERLVYIRLFLCKRVILRIIKGGEIIVVTPPFLSLSLHITSMRSKISGESRKVNFLNQLCGTGDVAVPFAMLGRDDFVECQQESGGQGRNLFSAHGKAYGSAYFPQCVMVMFERDGERRPLQLRNMQAADGENGLEQGGMF